MPEAHILGGNLLVQAAGEDDALLQQAGQELRGDGRLGQVDCRHAVRGVGGAGGELLEAELGDTRLDLLADGLVAREALREGAGEDLGEGGVEGVDELGRGGGEVRGFVGFVVLHDYFFFGAS